MMEKASGQVSQVSRAGLAETPHWYFALRVSRALLALGLLGAGTLRAQITTLASFDGTDGKNPDYGSLVLSGNTLYGTTSAGGANGDGEVFSVPVSGGAPTVLTSFNGTDGSQPLSSVILSGSTLYGMTRTGGVYGYGEIYSLPLTGGTPTVLFSFNGSNGQNPVGGLTLSGNTLYGTTTYGGAYGYGEVFSAPVTGGSLTILDSFIGGSYGLSAPHGSLLLSGNTLYGTTTLGYYGEVYSIPVTGIGGATVLATFNGTNGQTPTGSLILSGNTLYGTTTGGGANGDGEVFSLPVTGGTPTVLTSFNETDGWFPYGALLLNGSTLYGTVSFGGANGDGAIFSLPITGGTPTDVASFDFTDGALPNGDLLLDGNTFYGTTYQGGAYTGGAYGGPDGNGTVFAVAVPEPVSTALLAAAGVFGLATMRRRGGSESRSESGPTLHTSRAAVR